MQKKIIIFIAILIMSVLGIVFYTEFPKSQNTDIDYVEIPIPQTEEEKKSLLDKLSGDSKVVDTTEERTKILEALASSSSRTNTSSGGSSNTNLPSNEDRLKILESLNKQR